MVPDNDYEVRVLGVNYQGTMSEPSESLSFSTLGRSEIRDAMSPKDADSTFVIECTGDICVGDTVLFTERLFVKDRGEAEPLSAGASGVRSVTGGGGAGAGGTSVAGSKRGGGGGTVRMDMSVASMQSGDGGPLAPGAFLGERTIAATVVKDNYRTARDGLAAQGITPRDSRRFGKERKLWLQVVWQRASSEACKPYELKKGDVIERGQAHLEQFEVFRAAWRQENKRKPLAEEWESSKDCFLAFSCDPL